MSLLLNFLERILNANPNCEIDIFMHSWSTSHEKTVIDLYNPKDYTKTHNYYTRPKHIKHNTNKY